MNLNIRKAMSILALTTTMVLNKNNANAENIDYVDNYQNQTIIEEQSNNVIESNVSDYLLTTRVSIVKKENNPNSEIIGSIDENQVVYRILSCENNHYLIKFNNLIGYVNADDLTDLNVYNEIEHYSVNDLVETTSNVNFRVGPSVDNKRITTIKKDEKLKTIAKTSNNWYLIFYNGQFGYISGEYAVSLLETINGLYPKAELTKINVEKIVYVNASSLNVRSGPHVDNQKIGFLKKYESVKVLKEFAEWYLVITNDGLIGYISKNFTKELEDIYVVIDLSEQKLWLYNSNEVLIETDIVTGKLDTPTRSGLFKIYSKQTDRYLTGEDYNTHVNYWMPFDGGIGLHDASWRRSFGGEIYINDGSHGCVNMPKNITDDIFEKVSVGTKVLVHR